MYACIFRKHNEVFIDEDADVQDVPTPESDVVLQNESRTPKRKRLNKGQATWAMCNSLPN